jgi:hypothetical protein
MVFLSIFVGNCFSVPNLRKHPHNPPKPSNPVIKDKLMILSNDIESGHHYYGNRLMAKIKPLIYWDQACLFTSLWHLDNSWYCVIILRKRDLWNVITLSGFCCTLFLKNLPFRKWFDSSCETGNCGDNPDREAQLFGFLDQFFQSSGGPQESPTTPVDKINSKLNNIEYQSPIQHVTSHIRQYGNECDTSNVKQQHQKNVKFLIFFLGSATPIVIWHGLGQSCCDPMGIGRVKSVIEKATGAYVVSIKIGDSVLDDTINGFFKPVNQQVALKSQLLFKNSLSEIVFQQIIKWIWKAKIFKYVYILIHPKK